MSNGRQIPWLRIFVEGAVIVGSILLAFGIDAWWSERGERAEEGQAVALLAIDFRANAARLDTVRSFHQRALDASYEVLALGGLGGEPSLNRPPAELVGHLLSAWTYDPALGGINFLIQSGKLGRLRSDSLRVALAGWPDLVGDLNEDEVREQETMFKQLDPYLIMRGAMFDAQMAKRNFGRLEPRPASDLGWLMQDSVFLQMVAFRTIRLEEVLAEVDRVDASIRRILQLLEEN